MLCVVEVVTPSPGSLRPCFASCVQLVVLRSFIVLLTFTMILLLLGVHAVCLQLSSSQACTCFLMRWCWARCRFWRLLCIFGCSSAEIESAIQTEKNQMRQPRRSLLCNLSVCYMVDLLVCCLWLLTCLFGGDPTRP